jgi:hypothetical protein
MQSENGDLPALPAFLALPALPGAELVDLCPHAIQETVWNIESFL